MRAKYVKENEMDYNEQPYTSIISIDETMRFATTRVGITR